MTAPQKARQILVLEVELEHIDPRIWRRFSIRSDTFLPKLHLALQIVMGWENYHLHEFSNDLDRFGVPDEDFPDQTLIDEKRIRVSQLFSDTNTSVTYSYDFGDGWSHVIRLVKVVDWSPSSVSPICIAGERSCPPEDVGGPPGYETYLAALADPQHEMHNQYVEWRGSKFEPDSFDINAVNVLLGRKIRTGA